MRGCISSQIEHRLFSPITLDWRGQALISHQVVVQTIAATRTSGALRVEAVLDTATIQPASRSARERMVRLPLERHATHGAWNYTLHTSRVSSPADAGAVSESRGPAQHRQATLTKLADPRLTGMTAVQLDQLAAALAPVQAAWAQQRYGQQRGGGARRATGNVRTSAAVRRGAAAVHPPLPKAGLLH